MSNANKVRWLVQSLTTIDSESVIVSYPGRNKDYVFPSSWRRERDFNQPNAAEAVFARTIADSH